MFLSTQALENRKYELAKELKIKAKRLRTEEHRQRSQIKVRSKTKGWHNEQQLAGKAAKVLVQRAKAFVAVRSPQPRTVM